METIVGVGDVKAVRKWSLALSVDAARKRYFNRFIGRSENAVIQEKPDLESASGDTVQFDLSMRLRERPVYGDDRIEGKEEALVFYTDEVKIDQVRKAISSGGRMTRKRTIHDLRRLARDRGGEYLADWMDELFFIYLSGARGVNADVLVEGAFAGNPLQAPDALHQMYGGDATSKATIVADDKMGVSVVERVMTKAKMLNAVDPDTVDMMPVDVDGEKHFILLMSPWDAHNMRNSATAPSWSEIQRAAAGAEGRNNPIFKGGLGMINNVILHEHRNVRRFTDYGAGGNVHASRCLFMGRQAGVIAYGTPSRSRIRWIEKLADADNLVNFYAGMIMGVKKTRFNDRDFGVIAVDVASANPN